MLFAFCAGRLHHVHIKTEASAVDVKLCNIFNRSQVLYEREKNLNTRNKANAGVRRFR